MIESSEARLLTFQMRCAELEAKITDLEETIEELERTAGSNEEQIESLKARGADMMIAHVNSIAMLADPAVVHIAMLRGSIAKLSITNCLHLHGATNFDGWNDMTINEIEAMISKRDAEQ